MSTEYTGFNSFPATITVPDDGDETAAASVVVALEQLADRTKYLEAIVTGGAAEFTNAVLHGNTTMPDGSLVADLTGILLHADNTVALDSDVDITLHADANVIVTAVSVDLLGGKFLVDATHLELADDVSLGGGTGDTVTVQGTLAAVHNATFAAGKTVTLSGTTTAADLRATVSNASGITYSGAGRAHYRQRSLVEADFGGTYFIIGADIADIFYVTALSSGTQTMKLGDSFATAGDVIEVSTLGMTGGFNVEIYDDAGTPNLLLTMTATGNSWSRWVKKTTSGWRLIGVSDG